MQIEGIDAKGFERSPYIRVATEGEDPHLGTPSDHLNICGLDSFAHFPCPTDLAHDAAKLRWGLEHGKSVGANDRPSLANGWDRHHPIALDPWPHRGNQIWGKTWYLANDLGQQSVKGIGFHEVRLYPLCFRGVNQMADAR
jgi:hypothetical protein